MQRACRLVLSPSSLALRRSSRPRPPITVVGCPACRAGPSAALPSSFDSHQPLQYIMRHLNTTTGSGGARRKQPPSSSSKRSSSSLASRALVAAATASASCVAYYCATALVLGSSVASADDSAGGAYKFERKKDDLYGIEYVGLDSYPGTQFDDGSGVATPEAKAASAAVVSRALSAAGLDEKTCIVKGIAEASGDDVDLGDENGVGVTLHPRHVHRAGLGTCPVYGCPFLPLDVHYDEDAKSQLERLRKKDDSSSEGGVGSDGKEELDLLIRSSGSEKAATLTLIGYKGGKLENQVNQDRALALAPYMFRKIGSPSDDEGSSDSGPVVRLIGAFDGHAKYGERVSEYVVKTLPALLGSKLVELDRSAKDAAAAKESEEGEASAVDDGNDGERRDREVSKILHDTFLELDATSPAEPSGGCTASVVLQVGSKVYVANAGDSRSFVAAHVSKKGGDGGGVGGTGETSIIFATREDKPHLTGERERVESMGGTVYLPNGFLATGKGTTRVLYQDPMTGSTSGLAMSRSIGDWDAGEVGVVPDPLIDVLDIAEIKRRVAESMNEKCKMAEAEVDPASGESQSSEEQCSATYTEGDVKVFALSATDGLLDYLPEQSIVNHVAKSLYEEVDENAEQKVSHPLLACEDLIYAAAQGWQQDKGGRYRDDIAIAVIDMEVD